MAGNVYHKEADANQETAHSWLGLSNILGISMGSEGMAGTWAHPNLQIQTAWPLSKSYYIQSTPGPCIEPWSMH